MSDKFTRQGGDSTIQNGSTCFPESSCRNDITLTIKINSTRDVNPAYVRIIIDKLKPSVKRHSNICRIIILATTILGATHPTESNNFGYSKPDRTDRQFCDYKEIGRWSWLEAKYFNARTPT